MLESAGYQVIDLGVDVPVENYLLAVQKYHPQIVAISALLTTTLPGLVSTIGALQNAGLRSQVKIIIGRRPVTESLAQKIGADGYAPDASRAVKLVNELIYRLFVTAQVCVKKTRISA